MGSHSHTCLKGGYVGLGLMGALGVEVEDHQGVAVLLADGVGLIGEY